MKPIPYLISTPATTKNSEHTSLFNYKYNDMYARSTHDFLKKMCTDVRKTRAMLKGISLNDIENRTNPNRSLGQIPESIADLEKGIISNFNRTISIFNKQKYIYGIKKNLNFLEAELNKIKIMMDSSNTKNNRLHKNYIRLKSLAEKTKSLYLREESQYLHELKQELDI
jgi:hypothetical protein